MRYRQAYITYWTSVGGRPLGEAAGSILVPFFVHTAPIRQTEPSSDFRSIDEIINDGDADGLKFESYCFGSHQEVPFQNKQRAFASRDK